MLLPTYYREIITAMIMVATTAILSALIRCAFLYARVLRSFNSCINSSALSSLYSASFIYIDEGVLSPSCISIYRYTDKGRGGWG